MRRVLAVLLAAAVSTSALADNVAFCEILLLQVIEGADVEGEAQVASYGPAVDYITSIYDEEDGHMTHIGELPIRALMCKRQSVIPSEVDYPLVATGIPFIISQDFDSPDTDSLTMYWKDGTLGHVYKGQALSSDSQSTLDERLASFSDLGLATIAPKQASLDTTDLTSDIEGNFENTAVVTGIDAPVIGTPETYDVEIFDLGSETQDINNQATHEIEIQE